MVVRLSGFVVTGPAGTGRSTALREWTDDAERARRVRPRIIEAALDRSTPAELSEWHASTDPDVVLAVDDADRFDDDQLHAVASIAADRTVGLSVAVGRWSDALDRLIERLEAGTESTDPATIRRLEPWDAARAADVFSLDVDAAAPIVAHAGGNAALVAAAVRHGWDGDLDGVPLALVDSVLRRTRRLPSPAIDAVRLVSLGVGSADAFRLVESGDGRHDGPGEPGRDVARELVAAGLASDPAGPPAIASLVVACIGRDSTDHDRARIADLAVSSLERLAIDVSPFDAARIRLAATVSSPVERAAAAVRLGRPDAAALLAELPDLADPSAAAVAFAEDVRQLRLDRAVSRRLEGPLGEALVDVALTLTGLAGPSADRAAPTDPTDPTDSATALWRGLDAALGSYTAGDGSVAVRDALRVHDDALRSADATPAGITPSAISALLLLQAGDAALASEVIGAARRHDVGGPGERRTNALIDALASVQLGDYSAALDLTRANEQTDRSTWTGREALLLASLDAAIARRAGDTARLREAWLVAQPLLERSLETWLLFDQLVDITATGVRVGDPSTARATFDRLAEQLARLPEAGPGPVMAMWGALQLAVAGEQWTSIAAADPRWADAAAGEQGRDERSQARILGRLAWSEVATARLGGDSAAVGRVRDAADALAAVGDAWDASRLLGQAALDDDDPQQARELLEAARALVTEPVESTDRLVSAGLSEREAEVSRLVVEGHTYKEIGAQLYISPKTVEHHVARIRQRLGAGSRAELLAIVRELVGA